MVEVSVETSVVESVEVGSSIESVEVEVGPSMEMVEMGTAGRPTTASESPARRVSMMAAESLSICEL